LAVEAEDGFYLPPAYGKPSARQAVFDLVDGNTSLEVKCDASGSIHPVLNDGEKAVGLIVREKG
jgi:hypothetical protein